MFQLDPAKIYTGEDKPTIHRDLFSNAHRPCITPLPATYDFAPWGSKEFSQRFLRFADQNANQENHEHLATA